MPRRSWSALALCLVALVGPTLTGCSKGADKATADTSAKPNGIYIRGDLVRMFSGKNPTKRQTKAAQCMTDRVLAATSYQQLQKAGVLDKDFHVPPHRPFLDSATAETFASAQDECLDWYDRTARFEHSKHPRLDVAAYTACLKDNLDAGQIHQATVDYLMGHWQSDASKALNKQQNGCLKTGGAPSESPSASPTA